MNKLNPIMDQLLHVSYENGGKSLDIVADMIAGFQELPVLAQNMLFDYVFGDFGDFEFGFRYYLTGILRERKCNSPIEYIYIVALCITGSVRFDDFWIVDEDCEYIKVANIRVFPQYEIETNGKKYYADFLLSIDYMGSEIEGGQQSHDIVIECDGHEYHHATKEQVTNDNEREFAIKKAGYDVLRFSGSQIYHEPYKCANDTIDYIVANMDRKSESEAG